MSIIPLPGGADSLVEVLARNQVNGVLRSNALPSINPDIRGIVDTYFESDSPNLRSRQISPAGFSDSPVTLNALDYVNETIAEAFANSPTALPEQVQSGRIETTIGQLVTDLGLPSELLFVDNRSLPFYKQLWKYEGVDTVPGFLAGGVGEGGPPPSDVPLISDTRAILSDSKADILLEGGTLNLTTDYEVRISDAFDFDPGGGGSEDGYSEDVLVALGVQVLRTLEAGREAFDVPYNMEFEVSRSTSVPLPVAPDTTTLE